MRGEKPPRVTYPWGYWLEAGDAGEPNVPDAWDRLNPRPPGYDERIAGIMKKVSDYAREHPEILESFVKNLLEEAPLD